MENDSWGEFTRFKGPQELMMVHEAHIGGYDKVQGLSYWQRMIDGQQDFRGMTRRKRFQQPAAYETGGTSNCKAYPGVVKGQRQW